ncbi:hypothetical protein NMY22_g8875 [Coprinellus aureogranulatus]|nr:hypothetical protein NMY22_g8875 [Coprinellus aureogranulatus]
MILRRVDLVTVCAAPGSLDDVEPRSADPVSGSIPAIEPAGAARHVHIVVAPPHVLARFGVCAPNRDRPHRQTKTIALPSLIVYLHLDAIH